jgi:hypothetical protein
LRYAALRLAGGHGFLHIAVVRDGADPLGRSAAFAEFQHGLGDRLAGPPTRTDATLIGSYRFTENRKEVSV